MTNDLDHLLDLTPFARTLGMTLDAASAAEVKGRLEWAPERCTSGGVMHGGALMALADTTGAICAFLNLPPDSLTTTITSATTFMRALRQGEVAAASKPLHAGRKVIVVQTELRDDADKLVAQVTQTQAVLPAAG